MLWLEGGMNRSNNDTYRFNTYVGVVDVVTVAVT